MTQPDDIGILADTALTMAVTAMSKSCSDAEIAAYFTTQKVRLVQQGLSEPRVVYLMGRLRKAVMTINRQKL